MRSTSTPTSCWSASCAGDSSRTTEGSGLGLNIAKSLVELQKGTFSIAIDGDLFKVGFVLPRTE